MKNNLLNTNIVVDTNILLESNSQFWKLITNGRKSKHQLLEKNNIKAYKICLLQTVLEELDGLKKNVNDNVGYFQRKTIQKLYVNLDNIRILKDNKINLKDRFNVDNQDNTILNSIIELQKQDNESNYLLYTNDIQLLLKQRMYNVEQYTDIEKIDINQIKNNIYKRKIKDGIETDKLEILLREKTTHNDLNVKKGYTLFYTEKDHIEIPVKCTNLETIEYLELDKFTNLNKKCKKILPKTQEQQIFLDGILDDDIKIITSLSQSGTGKTLLQLYGQIQLLALPENLRKYHKIVYIVNPSSSQQKHKELGYLPGSQHEKILPYMQGIFDNLTYIFNDKIPEDYDIEKYDKTELFEIRPVNFIRGSSISKSIIIVDEQQNLTGLEIKTVFSRVQDSSKFILIGDISQIDEHIQIDAVGIVKLINAMNKQKDKLPWLNILLSKSIRSEIINTLNDYFNNIFDTED